MSYSNVNNFIIIQADNRDPATSFENHRKRDSYGGVDCVAPYGTPIYAPDDCHISTIPNNGSGGNTIQLQFKDGWLDEMMHLERFATIGDVRKGDLIGYSGDTGAPGQPHVHWHRIGKWYDDAWGSTNRYNPFNYFTSSTAGGNTRPLTETEDDMTLIIVATADGSGNAGWIKKGDAFANNFTEPLTLLAKAEVDALDWFTKPENGGIPYRKALWSPKAIHDLIQTRGIRPTSGTANASDYTKAQY